MCYHETCRPRIQHITQLSFQNTCIVHVCVYLHGCLEKSIIEIFASYYLKFILGPFKHNSINGHTLKDPPPFKKNTKEQNKQESKQNKNKKQKQLKQTNKPTKFP